MPFPFFGKKQDTPHTLWRQDTPLRIGAPATIKASGGARLALYKPVTWSMPVDCILSNVGWMEFDGSIFHMGFGHDEKGMFLIQSDGKTSSERSWDFWRLTATFPCGDMDALLAGDTVVDPDGNAWDKLFGPCAVTERMFTDKTKTPETREITIALLRRFIDFDRQVEADKEDAPGILMETCLMRLHRGEIGIWKGMSIDTPELV